MKILPYESHLDFALHLVRKTRALIQSFSIEALETELKADKSPVTVVDKAVESLIASSLASRFPDHGIIGEEDGSKNTEAEYVWTIDPIDGTQNLAVGIPTYGSMLGLLHRGKSVVGVIDHPALDLTYYAMEGGGAFCDGKRISVDDSKGRYDLVTTSTRNCCGRVAGGEKVFDLCHTQFKDSRVLYDCFGHTQVAHGRLAALVEWNAHLWDVVPSAVLVREAGGLYVSFPSSDGLYAALLGRKDMVESITKSLETLDIYPLKHATF